MIINETDTLLEKQHIGIIIFVTQFPIYLHCKCDNTYLKKLCKEFTSSIYSIACNATKDLLIVDRISQESNVTR